MTYYMLYCISEDHPAGPFLKTVVWDENGKWIKIELTEKGQCTSRHLSNMISTRNPLEWYKDVIIHRQQTKDGIPYLIKKLNKQKAFIELL